MSDDHVTPNAEPAIFGNRALNNLWVGYDSSASLLVLFKPTDCSAMWSWTNTNQESLVLFLT